MRPLFDACELGGAGRAGSMLRCKIDEVVKAPAIHAVQQSSRK